MAENTAVIRAKPPINTHVTTKIYNYNTCSSRLVIVLTILYTKTIFIDGQGGAPEGLVGGSIHTSPSAPRGERYRGFPFSRS